MCACHEEAKLGLLMTIIAVDSNGLVTEVNYFVFQTVTCPSFHDTRNTAAIVDTGAVTW